MKNSLVFMSLLFGVMLPYKNCSKVWAIPQVKNPNIYVLIFADNKSPDISEACQNDKRKVIDWLSEAANLTGMRLLGADDNYVYSKAGVDSALRSIHTEPNDVIFFYYTGHGIRFEKQTGRYPYLDFYNNEALRAQINLEEVHQKLKAKGARLTITIGDLCNVVVRGDVVIAYKAPLRKQIFQKLFLSAEGDILVASSSPGQSSVLSRDQQSGLFTSCWLSAAEWVASGKAEPEWEEIVKLTDDRTIRISSGDKHGEDSTKTVQTPIHNYHLRYQTFQIK